MCGICGFSDFEDDFELCGESAENLIAMRKAIDYRGGDEHGEYLQKHVALGHARLSIRDISNGSQPMVRKKDGREFAVVFNGEIYNTAKLVDILSERGIYPETSCDTEVILLLYMELGQKFVSLLNGIFAFVIWDGAREQLMLARDRSGVKPLFYTKHNGMLLFSSEIKSLFAHPAVRPVVDLDSFREIFAVGPARTPGCGVFANISEILPAHFAVFDRRGLYEKKYWELSASRHTDSYEQTVENVSYLVHDAIKRQMVSDVPVCSFLSGGIDSSIVTAVACKELGSPQDFNTFSFDFTGNDRYFVSNSFQPERDNKYVGIMLEKYPTNHSFLLCDEGKLVSLLREATYAKDLPGMADVDASLLCFCETVAKSNKVVLTGECADEIFGGYPWFYKSELWSDDFFPWSKNMQTRKLLLNDSFARSLDLESYASEKFKSFLKKAPLTEGEGKQQIRHRQISYLNQVWFMQTLLDRMDRTSMHYGLEARVPFCDHRIIEYVYNIPWEMKFSGGVEKSLLREAFRGEIPDEVLFRKKSPYPKTYSPFYEQLLANKLKTILSDPQSPLCFICDPVKVKEFLQSPSDLGKPWFGQLMSSPQLIAYFIQLQYWFELYEPEILI